MHILNISLLVLYMLYMFLSGYNSRTIQDIEFKFSECLLFVEATNIVKFQRARYTGYKVDIFRISLFRWYNHISRISDMVMDTWTGEGQKGQKQTGKSQFGDTIAIFDLINAQCTYIFQIRRRQNTWGVFEYHRKKWRVN